MTIIKLNIPTPSLTKIYFTYCLKRMSIEDRQYYSVSYIEGNGYGLECRSDYIHVFALFFSSKHREGFHFDSTVILYVISFMTNWTLQRRSSHKNRRRYRVSLSLFTLWWRHHNRLYNANLRPSICDVSTWKFLGISVKYDDIQDHVFKKISYWLKSAAAKKDDCSHFELAKDTR